MPYHYRTFRGNPAASIAKEVIEHRPLSLQMLRRCFTFDLGLSLVSETRFANIKQQSINSAKLPSHILTAKNADLALRFKEDEFFQVAQKHPDLGRKHFLRPQLDDAGHTYHSQICREDEQYGLNLEMHRTIFNILLHLPSSTYITYDNQGALVKHPVTQFQYVN